jgi:hypothetical protein
MATHLELSSTRDPRASPLSLFIKKSRVYVFNSQSQNTEPFCDKTILLLAAVSCFENLPAAKGDGSRLNDAIEFGDESLPEDDAILADKR